MLSANSISTTLLASNWSVQVACRVGGSLQVTATRWAYGLSLSLRSRPGHGRSLMAASSLSLTNRLRALATEPGLFKTASATAWSDSLSSAFKSARGRFSARTSALPRWDSSISSARWLGVSCTLYLMAGRFGYALLGRSYPSLLNFLSYLMQDFIGSTSLPAPPTPSTTWTINILQTFTRSSELRQAVGQPAQSSGSAILTVISPESALWEAAHTSSP